MSPEEKQQQIQEAEQLVKGYLSKQALERYGNIRASDPSKALQIIAMIAATIEQGKITTHINDEQLKDLLIKLSAHKRPINIRH